MNRTKTIGNVVGIFILLFFFSTPARSFELEFKLSGGYISLGLEGINHGLEDWAERKKRETEENKNWLHLGKNVKNLNSGIQLEGEIIFSFSPRLGISLGTGYVYGDLQENETEVLEQRPNGVLSQVHPITVSAYPVVLSGYFFIPLSSRLHLYVKGGGGFAWAKYVMREATKFETAEKYNYVGLERATATGPVFQGGLGFVYETDVGVRFFIEGLVRKAKINGFSGENQSEETGTLYYFEEYYPDQDIWLVKNEIRTEIPSGSYFRSVSEAAVDFSGLSVKIGFMIRF